MTKRFAVLHRLWTSMLVVSGLAAILFPPGLGAADTLLFRAQVLYSSGPTASFEVATIKLLPPGAQVTPQPPGGSTVRLYFTPKMLVMYAFNLPDFSEDQILKGAGWMDETYEIQGKIGDKEYAAMQEMPVAERQKQIQFMCQSLLKDRFDLKAHLEKREQTVYALEVAKTGAKLAAAQDGVPSRFNVSHEGPNYELKATGIDLDSLARLLSRQPEVGNRSTVNKTGLSGNYDVTLHWTRSEPATSDAGVASAAEASGPSYFTAIQEQLGLHFAPVKGPVDYVVVDHIAKPSAN